MCAPCLLLKFSPAGDIGRYTSHTSAGIFLFFIRRKYDVFINQLFSFPVVDKDLYSRGVILHSINHNNVKIMLPSQLCFSFCLPGIGSLFCLINFCYHSLLRSFIFFLIIHISLKKDPYLIILIDRHTTILLQIANVIIRKHVKE